MKDISWKNVPGESLTQEYFRSLDFPERDDVRAHGAANVEDLKDDLQLDHWQYVSVWHNRSQTMTSNVHRGFTSLNDSRSFGNSIIGHRLIPRGGGEMGILILIPAWATYNRAEASSTVVSARQCLFYGGCNALH
ncbi:hypothetical protein N7539_009021 [Penicillium diatomitis]|uniref:Uncharacterized protein n=1 Tax=Penicillium diatomitis TaxID=2819901 RepID=A0A9X0BJI0_9EURO|nr:uncharacterized protein N7539_009021 [Penicillium diatomitis]KAJ5469403.1 hypothetical protein N7539_009021 [Penicillium diatomitis]